MATGKRYYWIKLKESFMRSDSVDFLMGQPNGANYVVLYQMLHLNTLNTGGKLQRQIGEVIIPYDVDKIQRDCKWFSRDTIIIALDLYKRLGLVYEDKDGTLILSDHNSLVGSETDYAKQKRGQRLAEISTHLISDGVDNVHDDVFENVHTDIRDKILDIRDESIEIDIENNIKKSSSYKRGFTPPTLEEVTDFCKERGNGIDPEHFINCYEANGWMVGKVKMKDWKATIKNWERRDGYRPGEKEQSIPLPSSVVRREK